MFDQRFMATEAKEMAKNLKLASAASMEQVARAGLERFLKKALARKLVGRLYRGAEEVLHVIEDPKPEPKPKAKKKKKLAKSTK